MGLCVKGMSSLLDLTGCFSAWSLPVRIQIPQCSPSPQHMTVDVGHWPLCLSRMCTCLPVTAGKTRLLHILST